MPIECPVCAKPCSKADYAKYHIAFVQAKLNDLPEPSCSTFILRKHRGIDGVVDHPRTSNRFVNHGPLFMRDNHGQ